MKKLFTATLMIITFNTFCFAQARAGLFSFKKASDADVVLQVLQNELKPTAVQYSQLRDLIAGSAKDQEELFKNHENQTADMAKAIEARQTAHIESNMKEIIGEDKFKLYQQQKAAIERKVLSSGKR